MQETKAEVKEIIPASLYGIHKGTLYGLSFGLNPILCEVDTGRCSETSPLPITTEFYVIRRDLDCGGGVFGCSWGKCYENDDITCVSGCKVARIYKERYSPDIPPTFAAYIEEDKIHLVVSSIAEDKPPCPCGKIEPRKALYYTVWDGNKWSDPILVYDPGECFKPECPKWCPKE